MALIAFVPLALGGLGGALVSVLAGPAEHQRGLVARPARGAGDPLGVPHGVASDDRDHRRLPSPLRRPARRTTARSRPRAAGRVVPFVVLLFGLICGWVRVRDEIGVWWQVPDGDGEWQDLT